MPRLSVSETWNIGPLKITLSKSGPSVSLGGKGVRVGLNSKGQVTGKVGYKGAQFKKSKKLLPSLWDLFTNSDEDGA